MSPRKNRKERSQREFERRLNSQRKEFKRGALAGLSMAQENSGKEKMSEVLKQFVEPYRDDPVTRTPDGYRELLAMGIVAWNASLIPEGKRLRELDSTITKAFPVFTALEFAGVRALILQMMARKQTEYPENRRWILDFAVEEREQGFHLRVLSTPVPAP